MICSLKIFSKYYSKGEVLNRTVVLRDHDDDGIVFVTERNSRKYQDIVRPPLPLILHHQTFALFQFYIKKENPNVSATFLWCYHKEDDPQLTKHQIRITGTAKELNPDQIQKIYESEPISYKIRSAICRCGQPVNWNELKASHDTIVKDFLDGKETLKQNDS